MERNNFFSWRQKYGRAPEREARLACLSGLHGRGKHDPGESAIDSFDRWGVEPPGHRYIRGRFIIACEDGCCCDKKKVKQRMFHITDYNIRSDCDKEFIDFSLHEYGISLSSSQGRKLTILIHPASKGQHPETRRFLTVAATVSGRERAQALARCPFLFLSCITRSSGE
jgi:hypothetical protein